MGDFTEAFRRYVPKTAMQRLLDESAAAKRERELGHEPKQVVWMMDGREVNYERSARFSFTVYR